MNWDTTELSIKSENFFSGLLTIEKIKKTTLFTNKGDEKCYLMEVKENITYRNLETGENDSKKEFYTFESTYKGKDQASGTNDAFYYLVYHFDKKSGTKIPFRGYRLDGDLVNRIFFLSDASDFSDQQNQEVNKIIQEEKKRWDETGYTNEKDLVSDNKKIVDAKWNALHKDDNGKEWSPGLSNKEKEKIKNASTIEEVKKTQKEITDKRKEDKFSKDRENALVKDPQTGITWDPELTEDEKNVINDSNLDSSGAIQSATNLLSCLRSIRNDKENGGPGKLTDWNSAEKVNEALKSFQKAYYDNLLAYQQAAADNDQGQAWQAANSQLNNVAENIYQRYWSLICNLAPHAKLEQENKEQKEAVEKMQKELKASQEELEKVQKQSEHDEATLKAVLAVSHRWDEAQMIDRNEKDSVLGAKWQEKLEQKTTLEAITTEKEALIKKINDKEKTEQEKQESYEKEIQTEINKAKSFVVNLNLTGDQAQEMLNKLKDCREYGNSPVPAKYRAFLSKGKGVLNELITTSRVRIHGEEVIQGINEFLDGNPKILPGHLGNECQDFENKIRRFDNEKEINDLENKILFQGTTLRAIRSRLFNLISQADELLAQRADYDVWVLAFELEKFRSSSRSTDELTYLTYISRKMKIDNLVDPQRGELITKIREKASTSFAELLKSCGVDIEQREVKEIIASYREKINQANLEEIRKQKCEHEFLPKVLSKSQTRTQNSPLTQAQIIQPIIPPENK